MEIYRQSQNRLYCRDAHVNRIQLIAQPYIITSGTLLDQSNSRTGTTTCSYFGFVWILNHNQKQWKKSHRTTLRRDQGFFAQGYDGDQGSQSFSMNHPFLNQIFKHHHQGHPVLKALSKCFTNAPWVSHKNISATLRVTGISNNSAQPIR